MSNQTIPAGIDLLRLSVLCNEVMSRTFTYDGNATTFPSFVTFTPDLTPTEVTTFNRLVERANSRALAKAIPAWATWTQAELLAWFNANISPTQVNAEATLADAKVVQNKMADAILRLGQLLIAFRDFQWPDLQDR